MLMGSSTVCTICVLIVVVCTAKTVGHPAVGLVGISFVYVFLFAFAFVWTPIQALYPSEVCISTNHASESADYISRFLHTMPEQRVWPCLASGSTLSASSIPTLLL